jgi:hypothetical protein
MSDAQPKLSRAPEWQPYVAHLVLIAFVYGLLLAVVHFAFRSTVRPRSPKQVVETAAAAVPEAYADDSREPDFSIGPEGDDQPIGEEDVYELPRGGRKQVAAQSSSGSGSGSTLDRLEMHLESALTRPSMRTPKPRELLTHPMHPLQQNKQRAARTAEENAQLEEELEVMRRAEIVRREQERKLAAAQARANAGPAASGSAYKVSTRAMQRPPLSAEERLMAQHGSQTAGHGGQQGFFDGEQGYGGPQEYGGQQQGFGGGGSGAAPTTYVVNAPLDAVYGGSMDMGAPQGIAASLPLSPEERVMQKHVRAMG